MADAVVTQLIDDIMTAADAPAVRALINALSANDIAALEDLNAIILDADLMSATAISAEIDGDVAAAISSLAFPNLADLNGRITGATLLSDSQIDTVITNALAAFGFSSLTDLNSRIAGADLMSESAITAAIASIEVGGGIFSEISEVTASGSFTAADAGKLLYTKAGGPRTLTIPSNATQAIPVGSTIGVIKGGSGDLVIQIASDAFINESITATTYRSMSHGEFLMITKVGPDEWVGHHNPTDLTKFDPITIAQLNGLIDDSGATLLSDSQIDTEITNALAAFGFSSLTDLNSRIAGADLMSESAITAAINAASGASFADLTELNDILDPDTPTLLSSTEIAADITSAVEDRLSDALISISEIQDPSAITPRAWSSERVNYAITFALNTLTKLNNVVADAELLDVGDIQGRIDTAVAGVSLGSTDVTGTAGENISLIGTAVYLDSASNKWFKTDANFDAKSGPVLIGLAMAPASADVVDALSVRVNGGWDVTPSDLDPMIPGEVYYLSEETGEIVTTAPNTNGSTIRVIGYAVTTELLRITPDTTWITIGPTVTDIVYKTVDYTLTDTDPDKIIEMDAPGDLVLTIPDDTVDIPIGATLDVMHLGTGSLTVRGAVGVSLNGVEETVAGGESDVVSQGRWKGMSLYKRTALQWAVVGGV